MKLLLQSNANKIDYLSQPLFYKFYYFKLKAAYFEEYFFDSI